MPSGAELFVRSIAELGISQIFTLVGDHLNEVLAVAAREGIRVDFFITPLHGSRLRKANRASSRAKLGAIDLNRPDSSMNPLPLTSRREFPRRGFSIARVALPGVDGREFRLCKERSQPRHPGWRRRGRVRLA